MTFFYQIFDISALASNISCFKITFGLKFGPFQTRSNMWHMVLFETIFLRFVFYFTKIYLVCYSNITTGFKREPHFTGLGQWRLFLKTEDQSTNGKAVELCEGRQGHAVFGPFNNNHRISYGRCSLSILSCFIKKSR